MEKQTQVVDASVIVKWFSNEIHTDKALELKEKHILGKTVITVPDILFIEVINALRYKENSEETLIKINKFLWGMELDVQRTNEQILNKAIFIAKNGNLTIYDAIYVAIAQLNGAPLITADKDLFNIPNVISIEKI